MTKSRQYIVKVTVALAAVLVVFVGIAAVLAVLGAIQLGYVWDWACKLAAVAVVILLTNVIVACLIDLVSMMKSPSKKK